MQNQNPEIYFVIIIGIILGLLLVGFIVTILFLYQRRQHRQEQEMRKMKDLYENELLRSQMEIQESTLKTISQEIHDNIGQMLSVVKLSLSILPVEKNHNAFDGLQDSQLVLNKAIYDLSNLTKSLYTDRITEVGLADSIRFEAAMMKKSGLIDIQFQISGSEANLNEQKSIFLFRMFQEAMNNVLKHAQATQVKVHLKYLDDMFALEIKDNGLGFDVLEKQQSASSVSGVGLKSIFNRAQLIGAVISINSKPNQGTVILIKLPLHVDK